MWPKNDTGWAHSAAAYPADPRPLDPAQLLRVLDEIDYGLVVVDAQAHILHSNHLARHELGRGGLLVAHAQMLMGATVELTAQIEAAIDHACRGQRRLELFRSAEREIAASFIPLSHPLETDSPQVLVMLSRQSVSDNLAVRMYARAQGLSPGEELVLMALCRGLSIQGIAREHGVAECTVRSQVKAVRQKTGAHSIRHLLAHINSLPPVVPALRIIAPLQHNTGESSTP